MRTLYIYLQVIDTLRGTRSMNYKTIKYTGSTDTEHCVGRSQVCACGAFLLFVLEQDWMKSISCIIAPIQKLLARSCKNLTQFMQVVSCTYLPPEILQDFAGFIHGHQESCILQQNFAVR